MRKYTDTLTEISITKGWLEKKAKAHNREMHAQNGNASNSSVPFSKDNTDSQIFEGLLKDYRHKPYETILLSSKPEDKVWECEYEWIRTERFVTQGTPLACAELFGTCHTYLQAVGENAVALDVAPEGNGLGLVVPGLDLVKQDDAAVPILPNVADPVVEADNVRRRQDLHRRLGRAFRDFVVRGGSRAEIPPHRLVEAVELGFRHAQEDVPPALVLAMRHVATPIGLWIGVGTTREFVGPPVTKRRDGAARETKYGVDNASWPRPALATTLEKTCTPWVSKDWRLPALKVALYDMLRENIQMQPAGVAYDASDNSPALTVKVSRRQMDQWGYQAACITQSILERAIHNEFLTLRGQRINLWDNIIIVLNPVHATPIRWGLKILALLEYPLAQVSDIYHMVMGKREIEFIRNASNVTIPDDRRTLIFVVPDVSGEVMIGPLRMVPVSSTGAKGSTMLDIPLIPFDNALVDIVQDVLQTTLSLRSEWNEMVKMFNGGVDLDWSVISELLVHLIPRFPPQAEMTQMGGIDNVPLTVNYVECPLLFQQLDPNADDFDSQVAESQIPAPHDTYHHPRVVTAFDSVTLARVEANKLPLIRIGDWDYIAELVTGLGIMYLNIPLTDADMTDSMFESTRSILYKGRALRVICETIKTEGGLGDATVGMAHSAECGGKWSVEVNGEKGSLKSFPEFLLGEEFSQLGVKYSLLANVFRKDCQPTRSGYRSAALYDIGVKEKDICPCPKLIDEYVPCGSTLQMGMWVSKENSPEVTLRRLLGRVNTHTLVNVQRFINVTTKTLIDVTDSVLVSRVHSGFTERLALAGGWGTLGKVRPGRELSPIFAWGLSHYVREWANTRDVLIPIDSQVYYIFKNGGWRMPLVQIITD